MITKKIKKKTYLKVYLAENIEITYIVFRITEKKIENYTCKQK